jgi:hypothetical protein
MTRTAAALLVALAPFCAAGCKSSGTEAPAPAPAPGPKVERAGESGIRVTQPPAPAASASYSGPGALDYVAAPFENLVWIPWKVVGTSLKGATDGVAAGFAADRMPMLGLLFSPVNAVAGLVTGLAEGVAMSPMLVGPEDAFGRVMGKPMQNPTLIWWYGN